MSAPAADDEVGTMSAVSSESDAVTSKSAKGGRGKPAGKDREAATAESEGGEEAESSNSGGGESSDGSGDSSDEDEVRGRSFAFEKFVGKLGEGGSRRGKKGLSVEGPALASCDQDPSRGRRGLPTSVRSSAVYADLRSDE